MARAPSSRFIRFIPDQDTIAEVLIVLGIVTVLYFFNWADNLQIVSQQIAPAISEASAPRQGK